MSKRKRRTSRSRSKKKVQRAGSSSLVIPVIVGIALVAIIFGVIMLRESQQPAASALPGDVSSLVGTAQPLATSTPPNPGVPRATLDETRDKMERGEAVLVDVRSKASFDQAHAAGAISIPETEVFDRLDELPRDKEVVLYCT